MTGPRNSAAANVEKLIPFVRDGYDFVAIEPTPLWSLSLSEWYWFSYVLIAFLFYLVIPIA
jgi:hypothetical protein